MTGDFGATADTGQLKTPRCYKWINNVVFWNVYNAWKQKWQV